MFREVLDFWFRELTPQQWWTKDTELDLTIIERFSALHECAAQCELYAWRSHAQGRLAEILILDQFSRHLFRDRPRAFSQDPLALALAQEAVASGIDEALNDDEKAFLYLPYMHSESLLIHEQAVRLYSASEGLANNLEFELQHKRIIERFGRYPHRNAILGRHSSQDELDFLKEPGSSF